jgi:hypothetical protein
MLRAVRRSRYARRLNEDRFCNVKYAATAVARMRGKDSSMASNKTMVPEAKEAMNQFKMEAANEVGVNLKQGYNGDLTSRQAGSVGGQMVKNMTTVRRTSFERENRIVQGHKTTVRYTYAITV